MADFLGFFKESVVESSFRRVPSCPSADGGGFVLQTAQCSKLFSHGQYAAFSFGELFIHNCLGWKLFCCKLGAIFMVVAHHKELKPKTGKFHM